MLDFWMSAVNFLYYFLRIVV